MSYPIITRTKELRQVEIRGKNQWVTETVIRDYGPEGKTTIHILATNGTAAEAEANRRALDTAIGRFGYQLRA